MIVSVHLDSVNTVCFDLLATQDLFKNYFTEHNFEATVLNVFALLVKTLYCAMLCID